MRCRICPYRRSRRSPRRALHLGGPPGAPAPGQLGRDRGPLTVNRQARRRCQSVFLARLSCSGPAGTGRKLLTVPVADCDRPGRWPPWPGWICSGLARRRPGCGAWCRRRSRAGQAGGFRARVGRCRTQPGSPERCSRRERSQRGTWQTARMRSCSRVLRSSLLLSSRIRGLDQIPAHKSTYL